MTIKPRMPNVPNRPSPTGEKLKRGTNPRPITRTRPMAVNPGRAARQGSKALEELAHHPRVRARPKDGLTPL
ncbi:hypothetical protein SAMN05444166_1470 [Singulisphaera sp. GP187]|nr:hypothetical protein SAMN05444166_1470 [Singulisphaera sp. GP187]